MGLGRVGLVAAQRLGGGARPSSAQPRDAQLAQEHWQCWGIARLAGRQQEHQRQPTAINQRVCLGRQAAAGAPNGVIVRFVPAT